MVASISYLIISIDSFSVYGMDIFQAASNGNVQRVQELINDHIDVNQQNSGGYSPLHLAVYYGCLKSIYWQGTEQNYLTIIRELVKAHAEVDARTFQNKETSLHIATRQGTIIFVQTLIGAHADVNAVTTDLQTPLHIAAREGFSKIVRALILAQALVDPRSVSGLTPLHMACRQGHRDAALILMAAHADIEAEDQASARPLHIAIINKREEITEDLIAANAEINARASGGITPLHLAARYNYMPTLHMLVRAGADRMITTERGRKAIDVTADQSVITYLNKAPILHAELIDAVHRQDLASVLLLIALGAPICQQDTLGCTPIHDSIDAYDPSNPTILDCIARELIHATRSRCLHICNKAGQTPLHVAAMRGNVWIAEILLRSRANPNARDFKGNTPLHYALSKRMRDKLISYHADVSLVNDAGETPISCNPTIWRSIWDERHK